MTLIIDRSTSTWRKQKQKKRNSFFFFSPPLLLWLLGFFELNVITSVQIIYLILYNFWVFWGGQKPDQFIWKYVVNWAQVQNLRYALGLWNYINLSSFRPPLPLSLRLGPASIWLLQDAGWWTIQHRLTHSILITSMMWMFLFAIRMCIPLSGWGPTGFALDPLSTQPGSCGELWPRIGFEYAPNMLFKRPEMFWCYVKSDIIWWTVLGFVFDLS